MTNAGATIGRGKARAAKPADIVLLGGGVICLLALFYCLYWYIWLQQRVFTGPADIIAKIVFPAIIASALLGSLRFRPATRNRLAIFCLSMLFTIYAAELLLSAYPNFGLSFDTRTSDEVVAELRNRGMDAVAAPFPSVVKDLSSGDVLPVGGIANKLTVLCNESGAWMTYKSDEHGFNNPQGIWRFQDISIAAVGDSFVLGKCVPYDKNFVALIRRGYPTTLNLGMNGAGPMKELAAVKEYLPSLKPKVTLWFYFELNDLPDLNEERRSALLKLYLNDPFNQGLIARQSEIDQALTRYADAQMAQASSAHAYLDSMQQIIKLSAVRSKAGWVNGTPQVKPGEVHAKLFREILQNVRAFVQTWNGMLYFVYLPAWQRYSGADASIVDRDAILALVRGLNIPVIDIHRVFQAHGDPLSLFPFRRQGHYNEEGHRVVADAVLRRLSHSPPLTAARLAPEITDDRSAEIRCRMIGQLLPTANRYCSSDHQIFGKRQ